MGLDFISSSTGMHESSTYLAILDEGAIKHAREVVLRLGQKKFGPAREQGALKCQS